MTTGDLPQISASSYVTTTLSPLMLGGSDTTAWWPERMENTAGETSEARLLRRVQAPALSLRPPQQHVTFDNEETAMARRLVQVFIADSDENVPLADALLYSGEQKFTDATDQELFFEIDINTILKAHNEKRVQMVNKKVKERTEHLEPAKIRDLKMVVVTVAGF